MATVYQDNSNKAEHVNGHFLLSYFENENDHIIYGYVTKKALPDNLSVARNVHLLNSDYDRIATTISSVPLSGYYEFGIGSFIVPDNKYILVIEGIDHNSLISKDVVPLSGGSP